MHEVEEEAVGGDSGRNANQGRVWLWGGLLGSLDGWLWGVLTLCGDVAGAGRSTRSRAGQTPRYGMRNVTIEGALHVARNARRESEVALADLVHLERLEA